MSIPFCPCPYFHFLRPFFQNFSPRPARSCRQPGREMPGHGCPSSVVSVARCAPPASVFYSNRVPLVAFLWSFLSSRDGGLRLSPVPKHISSRDLLLRRAFETALRGFSENLGRSASALTILLLDFAEVRSFRSFFLWGAKSTLAPPSLASLPSLPRNPQGVVQCVNSRCPPSFPF